MFQSRINMSLGRIGHAAFNSSTSLIKICLALKTITEIKMME